MLIGLSIEEFGLPEIKWGWFGKVKGCWGLWGPFGVFLMGSKNPFQRVRTGFYERDHRFKPKNQRVWGCSFKLVVFNRSVHWFTTDKIVRFMY